MRPLIGAFVCVLALIVAVFAQDPVFAQDADSTKITFGGLKGDPTQPVTVTSLTLTMDEALGTAIFEGDVLVVQGEMRLSANRVRVQYDQTTDRIALIFAEGDVILVNAGDAAQSRNAEYVIDDGLVTMQGDVVLTQGPATFTAATLVADLITGSGQLFGGVRSTFLPSAATGGSKSGGAQ